ncbi:lysylphosphatidylglycerol synthase domain-containing protein [Myxacorys almedinensis]|uniref:UPF0104 family protein n=1 Tax=Myxacorys almedinensis A TaxID=2690445 RepID=A0A8J7ZB08_9CYAN|nr:lysylphosphatidylglycerol synthase domain-containing protein [Myxacorys almedinensis]NDJ18675.1 UPF0104 family protein [Myxacorys almedinensis A]
MGHLRSLLTWLGQPSLKKALRWLIIGAVLFFLLQTIRDHWQEVAQIRIERAGWASLAIATGITLFAHMFTGYVWTWILQELGQSVKGAWGVSVYLKTNLAKYLPGNVWHFYGRITSVKKVGVAANIGTLSVLLEPLLMVAAACIVGLIGLRRLGIPQFAPVLQAILLIGTLTVVHPRILNALLKRVAKLKKTSLDAPPRIRRYPILPLLGEIGFLLLRSLGFIATFLAIAPIQTDQIPLLVSSFTWAWLMGFIIPGLPGGVGIFEATAIALLGQHFSTAQVLSAVALYRLVNTLAETLGAGLVVIDEQQNY